MFSRVGNEDHYYVAGQNANIDAQMKHAGSWLSAFFQSGYLGLLQGCGLIAAVYQAVTNAAGGL